MSELPIIFDEVISAEIQDGLEAARWPRYYEQYGLEKTLARIQSEMPEYTDVKILQSGSTTAVIACDPVAGHFFVVFDPTKPFQLERDINFDTDEVEHSLGEGVHAGYYKPIVKYDARFEYVDEGRQHLVGGIENFISNFADDFERVVTVSFGGFSKAEVMAVLTSAEMLASGGMFDERHDIEIEGIYTFATPNYASSAFVEKFNVLASEQGFNVWNIEVKQDPLKDLFNDKFGKVGTVVSLEEAGWNWFSHSYNAYQDSLDNHQPIVSSVDDYREEPQDPLPKESLKREELYTRNSNKRLTVSSPRVHPA